MDKHSAWERLYLAVESLASGEGAILSRLENVYMSHILALNENEFQDEKAKTLFKAIVKPIEDGKMRKGQIFDLSNEEARQISKNIVSLFINIIDQD
ncbi:hypothetical protein [Paenibacillus sp. FSL E2-0178]|uniref:hypothetical protein n=1 Tax=Paenibacillus sp. FSL E2-0178 TaxID=2921361 RepID=UPI00315989E6